MVPHLTKMYFLLSRAIILREVVAPRLLSVASRKRIKALLPYYEANHVRNDANKIWLSITKNLYPLANTSFLQPAVLYYGHAVRTALSPNEGLKQYVIPDAAIVPFCVRTALSPNEGLKPIQRSHTGKGGRSQNSTKPE